MLLYRPVGHRELELIVESGLREFPARLPEQPIFYPVLNAGYAREIAEGWNTKAEGGAGYVTRFLIDDNYARKFEPQVVGGSDHKELWVPAEELEEFNSNLIGHIEVIAAYFGTSFRGSRPTIALKIETDDGLADAYLRALRDMLEYNYMDFRGTVILEYRSIFCNFAYWNSAESKADEILHKNSGHRLVDLIADCWRDNLPGINLPCQSVLLPEEAEILS